MTSAQPSAELALEPGRVLSFNTAACIGAVGAGRRHLLTALTADDLREHLSLNVLEAIRANADDL